jgi:methionyl-tRNA formyltransferase
MRKNIIIAAIGKWNRIVFERNKPNGGVYDWVLVTDSKELNLELSKTSPTFIFFLHWRWIIPKQVYDKFECVCFHMTNLPYGRGGSPLQNLILKGHAETMLSAIRMTGEVDAGPVYVKKSLSLSGPAHEIYERASNLSWEIVFELIEGPITPKIQEGEPTYFKRRKPEESEIPEGLGNRELYDFIRMLDAPGYPKAYTCYGNRRFEFDGASLEGEELTARVRVLKDN